MNINVHSTLILSPRIIWVLFLLVESPVLNGDKVRIQYKTVLQYLRNSLFYSLKIDKEKEKDNFKAVEVITEPLSIEKEMRFLSWDVIEVVIVFKVSFIKMN